MSLNGVGVHQMWGLSSAFDCLEVGAPVLGTDTTSDGSPAPAAGDNEPIRVLLVQPADIRHVLKTVAQRRRHKYGNRPIHFYVIDKPTEVIARHLLLLLVAHDYELPIRLRANTWLEVYANAFVQDRTAKYIARKGQELVRLICDRVGPLGSIVDTSLLRFRDVDELQEVFHGWNYAAKYDLETLREYRLRHMYGTRYDFRRNVLDWDYQMMVKAVCGNIHTLHYREWRQRGVAFEFGDQTYTVPNKTMGTYAATKERGMSKLRLGFWLDVVNSPYWSIGTAASVSSELDEQLFRVDARGRGTEQWRHTAVEMSVFNILAYFHEVETGKRYTMQSKNAVYSGLGSFDEKRLKEEAARAAKTEEDASAAASAGEEETKGGEGETKGDGAADGEEETKGDGAAGGEEDATATGEEDNAEDEEHKGVEAEGDGPPPLEAITDGDTQADSEAEQDTPSANVFRSPPEVVEQRRLQRQAQAEAKRRGEDAKRQAAIVRRAECIVESYKGVKVFPLNGKLSDFASKKRFHNLFDVVFVSNHASQDIKKDLTAMLKPRAVLVTELARGMVTLKKEQQAQFTAKVNELCRGLGCYFHGVDKDVVSDTFSTGSAVGLTKPGMDTDAIVKTVVKARKPEFQVYVWEAHMAEERAASWERIQASEAKAREQREAQAKAQAEAEAAAKQANSAGSTAPAKQSAQE